MVKDLKHELIHLGKLVSSDLHKVASAKYIYGILFNLVCFLLFTEKREAYFFNCSDCQFQVRNILDQPKYQEICLHFFIDLKGTVAREFFLN